MSRVLPVQMHLTFHDVAVYFSEEEWNCLERWQKELYKEVMRDNYENLCSVGVQIPKPQILLNIHQGLDCYTKDDGGGGGGVDEEEVPLANSPITDTEAELLNKEPEENPPPAENKKSNAPDSQPVCHKCGGKRMCLCQALTQNKKKPYMCVDCGKHYRKELHLVLHQKSHLKGEAYKCSLCEKSFRKPFHLQRHQRTHQKAVYTCSKCDACFINKWQLLRHMKVHGAENDQHMKCGENLTCEVVQKRQKKSYDCPHCELSFRTKTTFIKHQQEHKGKILYDCKTCGKVYTRKANFIKHLLIHTVQTSTRGDDQSFETTQVIPCLISEHAKAVEYRKQPSVHMGHDRSGQETVNQTNPSRQNLSCNGIKEDIMTNASQLIIHERTQSTDGRCPMEERIMTSSPNPLPRSNVHKTSGTYQNKLVLLNIKRRPTVAHKSKPVARTTNVEKLFKCTKCKKVYRHHMSYIRHKRSHAHVFVCHECGLTFKKLCDVFLHRPAHRRCKPYRCGYCARSFSFRSMLLLHHNTHYVKGFVKRISYRSSD